MQHHDYPCDNLRGGVGLLGMLSNSVGERRGLKTAMFETCKKKITQ